MRAVLPLQRTRSGLASPTNWHTPEFAVVAEDAAARRELLQHAVERCGSRLTLDFVDPELAVELAAVAALRGGRSFSRLREASPYLILEPDWERGLDRHLLHEARRRGRRLAERGEVLFEVRDGTQDLDGLLEEGLRVEVSGWKGREGTAVSSSPDTLAFYRAVAGWAAERGLLRLAFLRLGGRPLAFDLGFEYEHVHYLLKSGYEEGERSLAPGKQLRLEALRDCARRGVVSYEFLGNADAWKQDWTELRRERLQTHAFPRGVAGARGWAMHARLLPAARVALTHLTRTGSALKTARPGLTQIGRA